MRRVLWPTAIALSIGLTAIVALQGFSTVGWIKALETLAVVAFGAAVIFGVVAAVGKTGVVEPAVEVEADRLGVEGPCRRGTSRPS